MTSMESFFPVEVPAGLNHRPTEHQYGPAKVLADSLESPMRDHRQYRVIELGNKLKVTLIQDPKTDKASATMNINVGSLSDDKDMPGLAHAVEHVLLRGSKTHPGHDFRDYVATHSGTISAYTMNTSTVYCFEVMNKRRNGPNSNRSKREKGWKGEIGIENPDDEAVYATALISTTVEDYADQSSPLYDTLSRFAEMFCEPLFDALTVSNEMTIVDEEHNKNKQDDLWRMDQLHKSLSNPEHPYNHFGTGNYDTLKTRPESKGVAIQNRFIEFHNQHYSANQSQLVVLGSEPLGTLEDWVSKLFSRFPNKKLPQDRWDTDVLYKENDLMTQCFAKPIMDSRYLELSFPFLYEESDYESQARQYIIQLIGHQGPGSIKACIQSRGWATSLMAYETTICPGTPGMFYCRIDLTEKGLESWREIVIVFFEYLSLLSTPQEWFYEELKQKEENRFQSEVNVAAATVTQRISLAMGSKLPIQWLLSRDRLRKFNASQILEGLACLKPRQLRLLIVSRKYPGDWRSKEKWYGTEYTQDKIPFQFLSQLEEAISHNANRFSELHFPHKNHVLVTDLEVQRQDADHLITAPRLIRNDDSMRIWHKKDDQFWEPTAGIRLIWRPFKSTTQTSAKTKIFAEVFLDSLNGCLYDFEIQGFKYAIYSGSEGFEIHLAGYNSKLLVLLERFLLKMKDLEVDEVRLEVVKEQVARDLENWHLGDAYDQVSTIIRWLNTKHHYLAEEILPALSRIKLTDIRQFYQDFLQRTPVEVLIHGNLTTNAALDVARLVERTFDPQSPSPASASTSQSLVLPQGSNFVYKRSLKDPQNINNCIQYYLYVGDGTQRSLDAKLYLLYELMYVVFFNQLGSEEQLGYRTWAYNCFFGDSVGFTFMIQSSSRPQYLESRIEVFLAGFMRTLGEMGEEKFKNHKTIAIDKMTEKLTTMDEELNRFWWHIKSGDLDFDYCKEVAAAIGLLTRSDMTEFYQHYIDPASPKRAKIAVHLNAQSRTDSKRSGCYKENSVDQVQYQGNGTLPEVISDASDFKTSMPVNCGILAVKAFKEFEEV